MILSGNAIRCEVERGEIEIDPFRLEQLNPVSYDLRLGRGVAVYKGVTNFLWDEVTPDGDGVVDAAKDNKVRHLEMKAGEPFRLEPGVGYLMHTEERVKTDKFVPVLDGKSSIGRLFISVHQTAGFGDPGFNGQYTLEVTALHPVIVYPGMLFAQIRFHTIGGEVAKYAGNYVGDAARGPVPSRSWQQFTRDKKLERLIAEVKRLMAEGKIPREMTREQRVDWTLGNLNASTNHQTTREIVEAAVDRVDAEKRKP